MQFFDNSGNNYSTEEKKDMVQNENDQDNGVVVNEQNSAYYEKIMKDNSTSKDGFYDKDNIVVKIIMIILAIIIIVGSIYIIGRGM